MQLYAETNCYGYFKMTANEKGGHFSSFGIRLQKLLSLSDVELQRQAENDRVELLDIICENE